MVLDLSLFPLIQRAGPSLASGLVAMMSVVTAMGVAAPSFILPDILPLGTPGGWTWVGHF